MRAAWYERTGPAREVLQVGELPDPEPGPGEVRVRLTRSGVNPGDVKKRQGWLGAPMPYPRVVPHSDGAGTVDAVGPGVDPARVGRRAWVFGAQSYRPFGTAADATVVPHGLAVDVPNGVGDELGAALRIPGITAHRAVYGVGPVRDRVVLVHGVLGAVGSLAGQLATWGGATVVGTVRRGADLEQAPVPAVALDAPDAAARIRTLAPDGVERIVEVALSANADLDAEIAAQGAVVAAYASPDPRPALPFWPLLFANVTLRLLGSDDFPAEAKAQAARDLTEAAAAGALRVPVAAVYPLEDIAAAHEAVEAGSPTGRILLATGLVALVFAVGAVLPATRPVFEDRRVRGAGPGELAYQVLLRIPVGTVLLEEVAFRGVLYGMVRQPGGAGWATAVGAALFGLWHVLPAAGLVRDNPVAGRAFAGRRALVVPVSVLATGLAGVLLSEAQRRTGSLLPPFTLHWALNGLGYLTAYLVGRRLIP